jgi:hypothetical protein
MYEKLVNALRCYAKDEECYRCEYFSEAGCDIDKMLFDADDAIEKLEKKNEQLTKKLVRPRPPKRKACSCGKKKWKQWYHTDTGMWSLQCANCGKQSRQVKYQSQLNAAWNEIADSEIDPPKEKT